MADAVAHYFTRQFDEKVMFEKLNGFKCFFHEDVADLGVVTFETSNHIYSPQHFVGLGHMVFDLR